jgi:hypothetical protein
MHITDRIHRFSPLLHACGFCGLLVLMPVKSKKRVKFAKPSLLPTVTASANDINRKLPVLELAKKWLDGVDARSDRARNVITLYAGFCEDLGGIDNMTTGQREIARRAAVLGLILRDVESDIVRDASISDETFDRLILAGRTQANLLKVLGMDRVAKQVGGGKSDPEDEGDLKQHLQKAAKSKSRAKVIDLEVEDDVEEE